MFGPKCSGTLMVISIWGVLFLGILGLLFKNKSIGLFEDLPGIKEKKSLEKDDINKLYNDNAVKCWIGAGVYVVILVISGVRFCMLVR